MLLARLLVLGAFLWFAALVLAPLARHSPNHLIARSAALVYDAGSFVCHQRPARSFRVGRSAMPVCARCTGLYASAAAGGLLALLFSVAGTAPWRARLLLAVAAVPTVVTFGAEQAGWWFPSNGIRALAALPLGFCAAWVVVEALVSRARPRQVSGYHS
ncbi:MAG: hypothetical protein DMF85_05015 [Acidobacteria bacterium]|nr:MAG: hypothetical protein DMF85_05015 [Acidobacteriota bacterium]PYR73308.1 MAG: hypothetical protein DMF86_20920 [Acidobacteriota bacterium]